MKKLIIVVYLAMLLLAFHAFVAQSSAASDQY